MKLYYSSRGDTAFLLATLVPTLPTSDRLGTVLERLTEGKEDPEFVKISVLGGGDIKSLVKKCDPAYFLYLRDLSVGMLADYKKRAEGLATSGYLNEERVCIRFPEDVSAIQLLAAGICARASGVSEIIFSMERGYFNHEHAAACRLAGVDTVWLCDSADCVIRAAFGSRLTKPCDAIVGRDDEEFDIALSIASRFLHTEPLPCKKADGAIFLLSEGADPAIVASDMARLSCRYPNRTYLAITESEKTAFALEELCAELDGSVLVTSSFAESCAVLRKLPPLRVFVYGDTDVFAVSEDALSANEISPLQFAAALPSVFYPYTPILFSKSRPSAALPFKPNVTAFAASMASHVSRNCLSDEDMACIANRLERATEEKAEQESEGDLNEV